MPAPLNHDGGTSDHEQVRALDCQGHQHVGFRRVGFHAVGVRLFKTLALAIVRLCYMNMRHSRIGTTWSPQFFPLFFHSFGYAQISLFGTCTNLR